MDQEKEKQPRRYGYGYGSPNYGYADAYGYGANDATGTAAVRRTIRDYVVVLRERKWYVASAFLIIFSAVLIYTFVTTPIYRSTATVEIFRHNPTVTQAEQVVDGEVRTAEDINTQVDIVSSSTIIQRVAGNLKGEKLQRFLKPYPSKDGKPVDILKVLEKHRIIVPERLSLVVDIEYDHPDENLASDIANMFAEEYTAYSAHVRVEESLKAVEDLKARADEQRKKVDDLAKELQSYREKNNLVSLDERKDIVTDKLKALGEQVTQDNATLQDAETRWKQVETARRDQKDLLTLSFIASVPTVSSLQQQVASAEITVAQLSEHYRSNHPKMIEARNSLQAAQKQLRQALDYTASQIEGGYQTALQNYNQAKASLATQETDSLSVDRFAVEYANLERDFDVNEKLLEHLLGRMRETAMSSSVESQIARIVDRARPVDKAIWPIIPLNIAVGILLGLGFGVGIAFLVDHFDDRIKSAHDIEVVIGLPLLSIVPKFKNLLKSGLDWESTSGHPTDREVNEAFSTLYSSLKLKEETKKAQCIVITSTIPGEGKSFVTRNLAHTFAAHGEKTLLVDCDLRRPTVHTYFNVENVNGVIGICTSGLTVDKAIVKSNVTNLDLLTAGGRSKQPAQDLTSKRFEEMLMELRKRYDRILLDTPPVALVSDALLIIPLADGSIYTIFFNKVKKKAAEFCVRRILEFKTPNLGAVLNGLDMNFGGHYYHQHYYQAYKDYYITPKDAK